MRVLLVDDDLAIRTVVRFMLERAHFTVLAVESGSQAIEAVRRQAPDLVLCDMMLPDMNGLEVIEVLHGERPELKIIAMSGDDSMTQGSLTTALELGAAAAIQKPFTRPTLLATIRSIVGAAAVPCAVVPATPSSTLR